MMLRLTGTRAECEPLGADLGGSPRTAGRGRRLGRAVETVLTVAVAGIATAVAVNGMWRVFGDALHLDGWGRVAAAGFLELALLVSALRARRSLREHGSVGVDGAAVWVIAVLSALVSAADAEGLAKAVRLAAPVLAAWLWERGLAADRRAVRDRRPATVAWRWTTQRVAVRLGLADPIERSASEVDRARRLAALTRARLRLAVLESSRLPWSLALVTGRPVRIAWASWRLQRHTLAAVEHLHLGTDPAVPATIRTTVAAVVGLRAATTPTMLAATTPWRIESSPAATSPAGSSPIEPGRIELSPVGLDRSGSDRIAVPERGSAQGASLPVSARSVDVERLRRAIADGVLPARPSVEAVRRHLRISAAYARAARASLTGGDQ